ncbi:MAG: cyclic pyranopterin monophosphate synthase MoaC, partial [bacterium]
ASVPGDKITVRARVKASDATGVEMEALNAASTAALTLYDMCKCESKKIKITNLHLLEKAGGKSGNWKDGGS